MLFLFYVLVFWPWGMWDLGSLTRDQTQSPHVGTWSLNLWTTRKVPPLTFLLAEHTSPDRDWKYEMPSQHPLLVAWSHSLISWVWHSARTVWYTWMCEEMLPLLPSERGCMQETSQEDQSEGRSCAAERWKDTQRLMTGLCCTCRSWSCCYKE